MCVCVCVCVCVYVCVCARAYVCVCVLILSVSTPIYSPTLHYIQWHGKACTDGPEGKFMYSNRKKVVFYCIVCIYSLNAKKTKHSVTFDTEQQGHDEETQPREHRYRL